MSITEIYETINEISSLKEKLADSIKKIIDSDLDLETKWELFIKSDVGEIESYSPPFVDDNIYEHNGGPLCANRYETIYAVNVIEVCEESDDPTKFDMNKFKSDCMKNMIKGWTFDW